MEKKVFDRYSGVCVRTSFFRQLVRKSIYGGGQCGFPVAMRSVNFMQDKFLALPSAASYYALSAENRRNSIELDEFSFFSVYLCSWNAVFQKI